MSLWKTPGNPNNKRLVESPWVPPGDPNNKRLVESPRVSPNVHQEAPPSPDNHPQRTRSPLPVQSNEVPQSDRPFRPDLAEGMALAELYRDRGKVWQRWHWWRCAAAAVAVTGASLVEGTLPAHNLAMLLAPGFSQRCQSGLEGSSSSRPSGPRGRAAAAAEPN